MSYTETIGEAIGIIDVLNYQTVNNASVSSLVGIDMSKYRRCRYTIVAPSLGSAGTLDGRLQGSSASTFSSVTNLTGTNLTQLTTTSTPSNNAIVTIEVRADQMAQQNNTLRYVRLNLTGGGNPITLIALGEGKDPVQHPGPTLNSSFIQQSVVSNQ